MLATRCARSSLPSDQTVATEPCYGHSKRRLHARNLKQRKDLLTGGVAALTPQTRARSRRRVHRLVLDALPDRRCALELPTNDRSLRYRQPIRRIRKTLRHGSAGGNQEDPSGNPRQLQDRAAGRAVHDAGSDALPTIGDIHRRRARNAQPTSWSISPLLGVV